jgi:hypothetical protein
MRFPTPNLEIKNYTARQGAELEPGLGLPDVTITRCKGRNGQPDQWEVLCCGNIMRPDGTWVRSMERSDNEDLKVKQNALCRFNSPEEAFATFSTLSKEKDPWG